MKRKMALLGLLALAVSVFIGAEPRYASQGTYLTSFTKTVGQQDAGARYFALAGSLTANADSLTVIHSLYIKSSASNTLTIRLYGNHGVTNQVGTPITRYSPVYIPPGSTINIDNAQIYGMMLVTNPNNTVYFTAKK